MSTQKVDVQGFLESQELDFLPAKGASKELIVVPCPFCGNDKEKFYINKENGLFNCKGCSEKGNFFKFKKAYGVIEGIATASELIGNKYQPLNNDEADAFHAALLTNPAALDYLASRGFNGETIERFKLGYKKDSEGGWIAIPHYQEEKLWNFKFRRFEGGEKTFRRINGQPTMLFNIDNISYEKNSLCIVESETDCMAAVQMGVTNVVGLTAGADTFKPEWLAITSQFKTIYVLLNSDDAGQKGARKLAEKIGLQKCLNIIPPTNDVNDFLKDPTRTAEDFKTLFGKGAKFDVQNVSTAADIVSKLDEWFSGTSNELKGLDTGFEQLDNITNGLKQQDLVIVSGDSGIGKTTFVNNIVNHQIQLNRPVMGLYLEGQIPYYFTRMLGAEYGLLYNELNKDPEKYEEIKKHAATLPLFYYSGPQGGITIEYLKEFIPAVVALYDIKVLMIDNLQKMIRGADQMYHQRISEAVSVLKDLAVDLNITVILISHVRKRDANQTVITMHDMKSSSTIYQDADQVWILQPIKGQYYLTIEKNRMGEGGVNIPFEFKKDYGSFHEEGTVVASEEVGRVPRMKRKEVVVEEKILQNEDNVV